MTTALEGGEGSASRPGCSLPPGKTRYPLYRRLGGPQGRSGQVRKSSTLPGFDLRTVQAPSNSLYRLSNPVPITLYTLCKKLSKCLEACPYAIGRRQVDSNLVTDICMSTSIHRTSQLFTPNTTGKLVSVYTTEHHNTVSV